MKNRGALLKGSRLKEVRKGVLFTPAKVRRMGNRTYIDLTEPRAYLPAKMYHPEDDLYED